MLFEYVAVLRLRQDVPGILKPVVTDVYPETDALKDDAQQTAPFLFPDIDIIQENAQKRAQMASSGAPPAPRPRRPYPVVTFVLTDKSGRRKFCFAQRVKLPDEENVCVVSLVTANYWPTCFASIVKWCTDALVADVSFEGAKKIADMALKAPMPLQGCMLEFGDGKYSVLRPSDENRPVCENAEDLFRVLGAAKLLNVFASVLMERRIAVISNDIAKLSRCVLALSQLLWPFVWESILIPILPGSLTEYLDAPMPFLIGMLDHSYAKNPKVAGDAIVIDLDRKTTQRLPGDIVKLPPKLVEEIRGRLYLPGVTGEGRFNNEKFFYAFTVFIAKVMCNYRDFVLTREINGEDEVELYFDKEGFINCHDKSEKDFMTHVCETQYFEQFISRRLNEIHMTGKLKILPFDSIVEKECKKHMRAFSMKSRSKLRKVEGKMKKKEDAAEEDEAKSKMVVPAPQAPQRPQKKPQLSALSMMGFEDETTFGSEGATEFVFNFHKSQSTHGSGEVSSPESSLSSSSDSEEENIPEPSSAPEPSPVHEEETPKEEEDVKPAPVVEENFDEGITF